MGFFTASTQYGDWKGTAAADDARHSLNDYLSDNGLTRESEFLVAASFFSSEGFVSVRAFVSHGTTFDTVEQELAEMTEPIPVREISVELTTETFFGLFKRFDVLLTRRGLQLEGREYRATGV